MWHSCLAGKGQEPHELSRDIHSDAAAARLALSAPNLFSFESVVTY